LACRIRRKKPDREKQSADPSKTRDTDQEKKNLRKIFIYRCDLPASVSPGPRSNLNATGTRLRLRSKCSQPSAKTVAHNNGPKQTTMTVSLGRRDFIF